MATFNDWLEGARLRTLPAAIAPVIAGAGIAYSENAFSIIRTLLAASVALLLQIGVNFANDYSDGIRGTDTHRAGPPRLTGGGKSNPRKVLAAALSAFALAGFFGIVLVALSGAWWLLAVGAAAIIAAWYYTGGKYPYGYHGLGELFVLIFFGYVATVGTVYTQSLTMPDLAWIAGSGIGMIACALLMINNIRDIPTDKIANKRTLAVRLGEKRARIAYLLLLLIPILFLTIGFAGHYPIMMCALILVPWATEIAKPVMRGATGAALIPALKQTGLYEIGYAVLITGGIIIGEITGIGALIGIAIALMVLIFWLAFEFTSRSKIMRTRRSKSTRVQSSNARTKVSYSSSAKQRGKNSRAPRSNTRGSRSKAQRRRK